MATHNLEILAERARHSRAPADVKLRRLTPRQSWTIWALPRMEEPFRIEQTLTETTNEAAALECLKNVADHFDCMVVHVDADGCVHDVTQRFAETYANNMARAGFDAEAIQRVTFLSAHFTPDEIDQFHPARPWSS